MYIGEWDDDGHRNGRGIQVWLKGSIYEGYWEMDKTNGRGRYIDADNSIYIGEWKDNRKNGHGKLT